MDSKHSRTLFYILLYFAISISPNFLLPDIQVVEEPLVFEGEFTIDCRTYHSQWTYTQVRVLAKDGTEAFCWEVEDRDTIIKGVDYSRLRREFVVFTEHFDPKVTTYSLAMQGESFFVQVTDRSDKASYSPILMNVAGEPETIVYIEEGSSLIYFDLSSQQEVYRQKFEQPIFGLSKEILQDEPALTFKQFDRGEIQILKRSLKSGSLKKQPILPLDESLDKKSEATTHQEDSLPGIHYPAAVDPKTIVGFGDSITYGKIWSTPVPHLGYVPRLERMVNEHFYPGADGRVINEGIPGEQVIEGVLRLEDEVIKIYMGKYLLFHEGTNDCIHLEYSVDLVNTTIEYMMNVTLQYGIQPIISTLIPRDISYPNVTARHIERGRKISEFIRQLAIEKNLPMVDFWEIFSNHPDGYESLMGDYVHPGVKGYQVMAEEWLKALLRLQGPAMPTGIEIIDTAPSQISIQWNESNDYDFSHYVIEYGFTADALDRVVELAEAQYTFYYNIMQSPFFSRVYFRIKAIDKAGSSSPFTEIQTATFPTF